MAEDCSLSSCERLESDENVSFQKRSWRWQSVGRLAVALLVVAAVIGLFGGGLLGQAEAATKDGRLRIEYPRFARTDATYRILVYAGPAAVADGHVVLSVDSTLLDVLQVETVAPEPTGVELGRGQVIYRFRAGAPDGLPPIVLHVKTSGAGRHQGRIGIHGGESVNLSFWLYP